MTLPIKSIKTVAIFTNATRPRANEMRSSLSKWLLDRKLRVIDDLETSFDRYLKEVDLIVCLGGDGTILRLVETIKGNPIPVLGVNLGGLGFITEIRAEELFEELSQILDGNFRVEERMLLSATVDTDGGGLSAQRRDVVALNDIVVNREGLTRYMHVQIQVGNEVATRFPGDGVIIATPTGSTAYSLSAGGPIVHPALHQIVITPICPHTAALRPLVVSGNEMIDIRVSFDGLQEKALLSADGQTDVEIGPNSVVNVTKFKNGFLLVKSSKRGYFSTLREKFNLPG